MSTSEASLRLWESHVLSGLGLVISNSKKASWQQACIYCFLGQWSGLFPSKTFNFHTNGREKEQRPAMSTLTSKWRRLQGTHCCLQVQPNVLSLRLTLSSSRKYDLNRSFRVGHWEVILKYSLTCKSFWGLGMKSMIVCDCVWTQN